MTMADKITKLLTITLEFELGPHKVGEARITRAHEAVVRAATAAVQAELFGDNVAEVHSSGSYGYRLVAVTAAARPNGDDVLHVVQEEVNHDDPETEG